MLQFILWYYGVGMAVGILMNIGAGAYLASCIDKAGVPDEKCDSVAHKVIDKVIDYIALEQFSENLGPGLVTLLNIVGYILLPILLQWMIYYTIKTGDHLVAEAKKVES